MNIISTISETYADGPGIRYAIYVAGCNHQCKGCHNPQSWNFDQGIPLEDILPTILEEIKNNPMLSGITITGGDPMASSSSLKDLLQVLKTEFPDKDIWVYTGYTIEELITLYRNGEKSIAYCLELIDTLVDGRFEIEKREEVTFKGSSNQRFIHSPSSYLFSYQGLPSHLF